MVSPDAALERNRTTVAASQAAQKAVGRSNLRKLMQRRNGPGLLFLACHLGLIGLTSSAIYMTNGTWWVVPAMFIQGLFIVHLFAPLHECSHYTAFKTRWLNSAVFWFCALVLGLAPMHFKLQHADHHTYTQNIERDPQMIVMGERFWGYLYYFTAIPYFRDILSALVRHPLGLLSEREKRYVYPSARKVVQRQGLIMLGVYALIAVISIVMQSPAALIYWLIPRLIAEPVERIIRLAEHVGCEHTEDMLENTRTILSWGPVRWLSWNMPLHTAHHVAPQVPFHAVPRLDEVLRRQAEVKDVRNGYPETVEFQLHYLMEKERRLKADGLSPS